MAMTASERLDAHPEAGTPAALQSILEVANDLIHSVSADGRILYANQAWRETLGYETADLQNLSIFDVIHPDYTAHCREVISRVLAGENVGLVEVVFVAKDGRNVSVEGSVARAGERNGQAATVGVFRDATRRKAAEEALRESEERYRTSFGQALSGVALVSPGGQYIRVNRALCAMLGYTEEELLSLNFRDVTVADDVATIEENIKDVLTNGIDSFQMEKRYIHKDGHLVWALLSVSIVRDAHRRPVHWVAQVVDTTTRHLAEKALRESEKRYHSERDFNAAIFDSAGSLLVVVDGNGTVLRFNRACEELSGYSRNEVEGKGFWEVLGWGDPRIAARLKWAFERREEGLLPPSWEDFWVMRNGSRRLISWSLSRLSEDSSGPEYFIASGVDITHSREQEEALRESEERFRRAFDDASTGMALVSTGGKWLKVNRALCELVGYTEQELLATDFQSLTHPDDLEPDVAGVNQLLAGDIQTYQMEKRYIHKQGRIVWALLSVSLVHDASGQAQYFLSQIQDITARKRAEEAQRLLVDAGTMLASSIDYSQTLHNVARLVVRSLADYCVMYLLEEDGQIHRTAGAHSALQQELLEDDFLRYSPSSGVNSLVAQVIHTGEPLLLIEIPPAVMQANAYDDTQFDMMRELDAQSCMVVPLEATDRVIGAMVLALSGPKRRYSGAYLSLARDVARRAALALDNARLFQQAKDAIAGRDALLSVVSHDMTNYLMAISAFTNMLPDLVPGDRSPESLQLLEGLAHIRGAALQMDRLVRDLLDFAKVQAGQPITLDRKPVDLVALAREVVAQQHATSKHRIVMTTQEIDLTGSWDGDKLARVLVNLLSNAVKYSPRGGDVVVSIERQHDEAGTWAVLSVRDQGVGIPREDLPNLFTRFARARNVLDIKGAGLGLFSVHAIVTLHGGTVSVESEEGVGALFTVRLPINGKQERGRAPQQAHT
jgi:PAS domain S-box-containing protein